jgi:hypothetical protein
MAAAVVLVVLLLLPQVAVGVEEVREVLEQQAQRL